MLTSSSSNHEVSLSNLDVSQVAWTVLRWSAGIGIGLSAWGWSVLSRIDTLSRDFAD